MSLTTLRFRMYRHLHTHKMHAKKMDAVPTKTSSVIRRAGLSLIKLNYHKHRVDYTDSVPS